MQDVVLKFHPMIQKYTRGVKEHLVKVNDINDIRSGLEKLFPELGIHMRKMRSGTTRLENMALVNKYKKILQREDYLLNRLSSDDTEFYVVPLLIGAGWFDKAKKIIVGAALVAVGSVISMLPGIGPFIGGWMISAGISMMIGGVIELVMGAPDLDDPSSPGQPTTDSEARKDNKLFSGIANTVKSNTPIALVYGRTRVGGQFINSSVRSFTHGRNETVTVAEIFPTGAS